MIIRTRLPEQEQDRLGDVQTSHFSASASSLGWGEAAKWTEEQQKLFPDLITHFSIDEGAVSCTGLCCWGQRLCSSGRAGCLSWKHLALNFSDVALSGWMKNELQVISLHRGAGVGAAMCVCVCVCVCVHG